MGENYGKVETNKFLQITRKGPTNSTPSIGDPTWMMVSGVVSEIPLIEESFTTSQAQEVAS